MNFLSLIFRLEGDNSDFKSKVRDSQASVEGLGKKLSSIGREAVKAAGFGGLVEQLKAGVEYAAKLADTFERMDVKAEAGQKYANSARRGNSDINDVTQSFDKLRKNIGTALGNDEAAAKMRKNFDGISVSFEDIKEKSPEEIFNRLLELMASGSMTAQQFTDAYEVLGKQFGKLIPMANDFAKHHKDLLFTDSEIKELKEADNAFSNFFNNVKVLSGKALTGTKEVLGNTVGGLLYGGHAGLYTEQIADEQKAEEDRKKVIEETKKRAQEAMMEQAKRDEERDTAAKAHSATMDRVVNAEEEAAKLREKAQMEGLSAEEQINELLEKRYRLMTDIESLKKSGRTDDKAAETVAEDQKELAKTNLEILNAQKSLHVEKPNRDALSATGLFVGGRRDPLVDVNLKHLQVSEKMLEKLTLIEQKQAAETVTFN